VLGYFAQRPRCLVGLEACGGAHYWARELQKLGHEGRLMAVGMLQPYRTRRMMRTTLKRFVKRSCGPGPASSRSRAKGNRQC
jgi:transposase